MKRKIYILTIFGLAILFGLFLFMPETALAQAYCLHDALVSPGIPHALAPSTWLFGTTGVWNIALGIANAFTAIVLLFFAIVNIAHVQYDTYQLKKALPYLILGIILANFSMLIVRMVVDVSQVLSNAFMNDTKFSSGLACGLQAPPILGVNIILALLIVLALIVAAAWIGFLLWMRIYVLLLVAAAAPVAFVMMAFGPTQGLFKQWVNWLMRWAFMGPAVVGILWIASQIGYTMCGSDGLPNPAEYSFSITAIVVILFFVAGTIPFKLGGAVMNAWGGLGKKAGGLAGNAAWNNPWAKAQRAKGSQRMNDWLRNNKATGWAFRSADKATAREAEYKAVAEEQAKARVAAGRQRMSAKERNRLELQKRQAMDTMSLDEASTQETLNAIEAGQKLQGISEKEYRIITGQANALDSARKFLNTSNKLNIAKSALSKRRDIDLNLAAIRDLKEHNAVKKQMQEDLGENRDGIGIDTNDYDDAGVATGSQTRRTYEEAVNLAADFRAKSNAATTQEERDRYDNIATEYEENAVKFKTDNKERYNYDAILDRNTSGRRYKEINPRIMEEAEITYLSSTGDTIMKEIQEGDSVGTAEYRASAEQWRRAVTGRWDEVEDTASFAVAQHLQAVQKFAVQAAQGNAEGIVAIQNFTTEVQKAYDQFEPGTNIKVQWVQEALGKMSDEQRVAVENEIERQGGFENIDNFDMTKMTIDNSKNGQANRAFLQRYALSIHTDKNLGISGSPGAPVGKVKPASEHHGHPIGPGAQPETDEQGTAEPAQPAPRSFQRSDTRERLAAQQQAQQAAQQQAQQPVQQAAQPAPGEVVSPGGIILGPGAQAQMQQGQQPNNVPPANEEDEGEI